MSTIKKNLAYNTLYQILNVILPFITVPIVSRALGAESSGIYSYVYSIVNYFMIFGMLGVSNYGNRRIAKSRDDRELMSKEFVSIYMLQVLFNLVAIVAYVIYIILFSQFRLVATIGIIFLVSNMLDISWLYFGLEKFKITVTRNIIVKLISLMLVFAFVKTPEDLPIYTIIMALSAIFSQAILWSGVGKYIKFHKNTFTLKYSKKHFKGILILFIPVISYSVYRIMDKIMLGVQSSMTEVGYYEYAEKIIGIPLGLIAAFGTVMLPQASNLVANKNTDKAMEYLTKSLKILMFITIPCVFGLISISGNFSVLFLGSEYARTGVILNYLSITLLFTAWANVVRTQWLIPQEKDNIYVLTTIVGAVVNLVANLIMIPLLGGVGAAIGTILAEMTIMCSQSFLVRSDIKFGEIFPKIIWYLVAGLVMLGLCGIIDVVISNNAIMNIGIKIIVGMTVYLVLNIGNIKEMLHARKA